MIVNMKNNIDFAQFADSEQTAKRLSLKHERVNQRRIVQKANEAMKNILALGRMKKLDLIAINNRSIFNHSKKKRAQQSLNRVFSQGQEQLPQLTKLKVDLRSRFTNQSQNTNPLTKYIKTEMSNCSDTNEIIHLNQYSQLERGSKLRYKKSQKCMANFSNQRILRNKSEIRSYKNQEIPKIMSPRKYILLERNKVVFDNEYKQSLQKIFQMSKYQAKLRGIKQRIFLRKLKQVKRRSNIGNKI